MGKLIKNHWARLIVLSAAFCTYNPTPKPPSTTVYGRRKRRRRRIKAREEEEEQEDAGKQTTVVGWDGTRQ